MCDRDDGALVFLQVAFEPRNRFGIEMVRRLVEQQEVRLAQQHLTQRDAAALAAREGGDVGIRRRQTQRVHGDLERAVELPGVGGIDRILQARLLVERLFHLIVGQALAQAHRDLFKARQQRARRCDRLLDVLQHCLGRIELRLLR